MYRSGLNYRELTRRLRRLGCEFDRTARGDHEIWINPVNRQRTTIPN
ncbi:MAG: type II toxin-antitoxin system HicA family toxin [Dehalococcoidia bacterium]|nr:type II toxin-antitoxin system HicA family toxin [Dehalococcoidia bacterium]